jgi:hypothetical protein
MAFQRKEPRARLLDRLEAEIDRHQQTINSLRAEGHTCSDAERQLAALKEALALLR